MKKRFRKKWLKTNARRRVRSEFPLLPSARVSASINLPKCACIYKSELEFLIRSILDYPYIETGGQLFGFWKDNGTPVVAYALGPGPYANHQYAFFNQDMDYLLRAGGILTQKYALEHIGEWHSHHRLGLAHPSGHDAETMAHGVQSSGRNRFLLCIGECSDRSASIGGFLFGKDTGDRYKHVGWQVIAAESPYRRMIDGDLLLKDVLVRPGMLEGLQHG